MHSVESSQIDSVGYDEEKSVLYVKFKSEKVYRYFDVSKEVYNGLKTADSVGSCFSKAIKPVYRYEKVEFEEHFDDGSHTIDV